MDSLSVVRRRRADEDRLYVRDVDGGRVGWVCLRTGETLLQVPQQLALFDAAIAAWGAQESEELRADLPAEPPSIPGPRPGPERAARNREAVRVRSLLARVMHVHAQDRRRRPNGADQTAAQLARLDARWATLHAVPLGDQERDIDHLVIGPGGVFTVAGKIHPGAKIWVGGDMVLIDGRQVPYVRDGRREAARAAELLSAACGFPVAVTGMVVLVGAGDLVILELPDDVHVVNRRHVAGFLAHLPRTLDDATVEAIRAAAVRSGGS